MNFISLKMKSLIFDLLINGTAWTGFLLNWREDLDYWVKIFAGLSAIALSWVTIWVRTKNSNNKQKDE